MRFHTQAASLAFVFLALAALTQAAIFPLQPNLGKRMYRGEGSSNLGQALTYADLEAGQFQHEVGMKGQHPNNFIPAITISYSPTASLSLLSGTKDTESHFTNYNKPSQISVASMPECRITLQH